MFYFLSYIEIAILFILLTLIIVVGSYLCLRSYKAHLSIPSIKSNLKKYYVQNSKPIRENRGSINKRYIKQRKSIINCSSSCDHQKSLLRCHGICYKKSLNFINNSLCDLPSVSVIVPARNEEEHIQRCLSSLLAQNYPNFEIIAVNDNSIDNTLDLLRN